MYIYFLRRVSMSRAAPKKRAPAPTRNSTYARQQNYRTARLAGSRPVMSSRAAAYLSARGMPSKETGFVDTAAAVYAMNTTGAITLIPTIAQGASVNQRVGKKIILKSLQIRGNVIPGGAATTGVSVAWMIVYDRRPTGSLPAITDVLTAVGATTFTNDANTGRFKILRRWSDSVIGALTLGQLTDKSHYTIDEYLKLDLPCVFKAAGTGAIADIEEGALYLITVGDNAAGTGDGDCALAFRTRFLDL